MTVMNDVLRNMIESKDDAELLEILVNALVTVDTENSEAGMSLLGRMDGLQRPKPSAPIMTSFHIVQAVVDKVLSDREYGASISVDLAKGSSWTPNGVAKDDAGEMISLDEFDEK